MTINYEQLRTNNREEANRQADALRAFYEHQETKPMSPLKFFGIICVTAIAVWVLISVAFFGH